MSTSSQSDTSAVLTAVGKLFDEKPPVLVEVRFPKMGTSPDWFLCENAAALDAIRDQLGSGAEVYLNSVWDLKNPTAAVALRKSKQAGFQADTGVDSEVVGRLFDEKPAVLVEVRFPKMGTSSDWFLCQEAAALEGVLDRLGPGAVVYLNSVWDLKNPAGAVVFGRSKPTCAADRARFSATMKKRYEPPYERVTGWSPVPPAEECDNTSLQYVER